MRPAGKATEQRAEKRKPAKHPGGRKKTGAVYLGAKAFRWERASSLLLTASISHFWTMFVQVRRRDSFLDISIPVDESNSASIDSLVLFSQVPHSLNRKIPSSRGKMIIVHLFQTISDTANTFQVGPYS